MENNEKIDKLIEDLKDRVKREDMTTTIAAITTLFVAYMVKLAKIDSTTADVVLSDTINLIKEEI